MQIQRNSLGFGFHVKFPQLDQIRQQFWSATRKSSMGSRFSRAWGVFSYVRAQTQGSSYQCQDLGKAAAGNS